MIELKVLLSLQYQSVRIVNSSSATLDESGSLGWMRH